MRVVCGLAGARFPVAALGCVAALIGVAAISEAPRGRVRRAGLRAGLGVRVLAG